MPHPEICEPPAAPCSARDPSEGLVDCLADYLAPLFAADTEDGPAARLMAIRAMISYRPEIKADFIAVARSIAFSMSALAVLSRAATEDMPPALRLRYFGAANALSRSADQSERTMERRRQAAVRRRAEVAVGEVPDPTDARGSVEAEPDDPAMLDLGKEELAVGEAAIGAAVAEAMAEYTSSRGKIRAAVPDAKGAVGGPYPAAMDASIRQRIAKSELAAMMSMSERVGAVRRGEQGPEGNLDARRGAWQTQIHDVRETAPARPQVPI